MHKTNQSNCDSATYQAAKPYDIMHLSHAVCQTLQYWAQVSIFSSNILAESHCHKNDFVERTQKYPYSMIFYFLSVDALNPLIMKGLM